MFAVLIAFLLLYVTIQFIVAYIFVHPMRTPLFVSPSFLGYPQQPFDLVDPERNLSLKAWWVHKDSPRRVMICSHGFMMNRAELSPVARMFDDQDMAFLLFDFPAHGQSPGKKCGFGYRETSAVRAAVAEARRVYPGAKIILLGSSMGAAASAFTCGEDNTIADALILDSAYDLLSDAVSGWWRFLGGRPMQVVMAPSVFLGVPLAGFNPMKIRVSDALKTVTIPTLILHGEVDTLAPPKAAHANLEALKGPKKLVWFPRRNHSEARWEDTDRYRAEVVEFINLHT